MTKRSLITLLLSVVGGLVFALGMCMCLLPEWNAFQTGVIVTAVGAVILLALAIYRAKTRTTPIKKPSKKAVGITALSVCGAIVLGLGMCMTMIWDMMIPGVVVGIIGILALVMIIPAAKGVKVSE